MNGIYLNQSSDMQHRLIMPQSALDRQVAQELQEDVNRYSDFLVAIVTYLASKPETAAKRLAVLERCAKSITRVPQGHLAGCMDLAAQLPSYLEKLSQKNKGVWACLLEDIYDLRLTENVKLFRLAWRLSPFKPGDNFVRMDTEKCRVEQRSIYHGQLLTQADEIQDRKDMDHGRCVAVIREGRVVDVENY